MTNRELFKQTYAEQLEYAHRMNPEEYFWPIEELPLVLSRINAAIDKGSFNKDGKAFKATCKILKIKHTYRDIENFIGSQGVPQ